MGTKGPQCRQEFATSKHAYKRVFGRKSAALMKDPVGGV